MHPRSPRLVRRGGADRRGEDRRGVGRVAPAGGRAVRLESMRRQAVASKGPRARLCARGFAPAARISLLIMPNARLEPLNALLVAGAPLRAKSRINGP